MQSWSGWWRKGIGGRARRIESHEGKNEEGSGIGTTEDVEEDGSEVAQAKNVARMRGLSS